MEVASTYVNTNGTLGDMTPTPAPVMRPRRAVQVAQLVPAVRDDLAACCNPVTGGVLDVAGAERVARLFKALGDPTRLRLLSLIAAHDGGEACVCDLTAPVGLGQPTVSHHLKQLMDAGLLSREQRGRWAYYRVEQAALDDLAGTLRDPRSSRGAADSSP